MRPSMKLFATVLLLVMFLVATAKGDSLAAEKRTCEARSHKFKGMCVRHNNCANVCKTEGFHAGKCRGIRRRCFCTKHC